MHLLGLDDTFSGAGTTTVQHFHSLPMLSLAADLVPPSLHLSRTAPVMNTPDSSPSVSPIPSPCQSPSLSPICLSNWSINPSPPASPLAPLSLVPSPIVTPQESPPMSPIPPHVQPSTPPSCSLAQVLLPSSPPSIPSSSQPVPLCTTLSSAPMPAMEPRRSGHTNKGVPPVRLIKFCNSTQLQPTKAAAELATPELFDEAIASPDAKQWVEAMCLEHQALLANCTYMLVPLPQGRVVVRTRWLYKIKSHVDRMIECYKA